MDIHLFKRSLSQANQCGRLENARHLWQNGWYVGHLLGFLHSTSGQEYSLVCVIAMHTFTKLLGIFESSDIQTPMIFRLADTRNRANIIVHTGLTVANSAVLILSNNQTLYGCTLAYSQY